jgi:uncharacterized membrane protein
MSTLIVIDFADQGRAQDAYHRVHELNGAAVLTLVGAAMITVDETDQVLITKASFGKEDRARAVQSTAFALILGSLALTPVMGFAAGGIIAEVFAAHEKNDDLVDSKFRRRVTDAIKPGHAALVLFAVEVAGDEFARQLEPFGGNPLVSSLSDDDDLALARALGVNE